jgi:uncharacterized protein YjbJ (UPF0337 family)
MNKVQVKGRAKQVEGAIKEVVGEAVGNDSLKVKGQVEKTVGKAQSAYGDVKSDINKKS